MQSTILVLTVNLTLKSSGIAVAGGCLAILTALLPVVMQGGEDAFNEMKEEDADTWGSGNAGRLNKRR